METALGEQQSTPIMYDSKQNRGGMHVMSHTAKINVQIQDRLMTKPGGTPHSTYVLYMFTERRMMTVSGSTLTYSTYSRASQMSGVFNRYTQLHRQTKTSEVI